MVSLLYLVWLSNNQLIIFLTAGDFKPLHYEVFGSDTNITVVEDTKGRSNMATFTLLWGGVPTKPIAFNATEVQVCSRKVSLWDSEFQDCPKISPNKLLKLKQFSNKLWIFKIWTSQVNMRCIQCASCRKHNAKCRLCVTVNRCSRLWRTWWKPSVPRRSWPLKAPVWNTSKILKVTTLRSVRCRAIWENKLVCVNSFKYWQIKAFYYFFKHALDRTRMWFLGLLFPHQFDSARVKNAGFCGLWSLKNAEVLFKDTFTKESGGSYGPVSLDQHSTVKCTTALFIAVEFVHLVYRRVGLTRLVWTLSVTELLPLLNCVIELCSVSFQLCFAYKGMLKDDVRMKFSYRNSEGRTETEFATINTVFAKGHKSVKKKNIKWFTWFVRNSMCKHWYNKICGIYNKCDFFSLFFFTGGVINAWTCWVLCRHSSLEANIVCWSCTCTKTPLVEISTWTLFTLGRVRPQGMKMVRSSSNITK